MVFIVDNKVMVQYKDLIWTSGMRPSSWSQSDASLWVANVTLFMGIVFIIYEFIKIYLIFHSIFVCVFCSCVTYWVLLKFWFCFFINKLHSLFLLLFVVLIFKMGACTARLCSWCMPWQRYIGNLIKIYNYIIKTISFSGSYLLVVSKQTTPLNHINSMFKLYISLIFIFYYVVSQQGGDEAVYYDSGIMSTLNIGYIHIFSSYSGWNINGYADSWHSVTDRSLFRTKEPLSSSFKLVEISHLRFRDILDESSYHSINPHYIKWTLLLPHAHSHIFIFMFLLFSRNFSYSGSLVILFLVYLLLVQYIIYNIHGIPRRQS